MSKSRPRSIDRLYSIDAFLAFGEIKIYRPTQDSPLLRARCLERQSMTDHTLDISAALREAHLQRLEASMAAKAAMKPGTQNAMTSKPGSNKNKRHALRH